jgi:hypothetical protein
MLRSVKVWTTCSQYKQGHNVDDGPGFATYSQHTTPNCNDRHEGDRKSTLLLYPNEPARPVYSRDRACPLLPHDPCLLVCVLL